MICNFRARNVCADFSRCRLLLGRRFKDFIVALEIAYELLDARAVGDLSGHC
jgi:hypothetical protein